MAEFTDRGSRFLAYAFPVSDVMVFKEKLALTKKAHPKAVHHCFAYRMGTSGDVFRANDDGEPSGSAGKPILGQLDSRQVTDTSIIVVRYFGGTLLGVPGLIHAYKTAASLALQLTPVVKKPIEVKYDIQFDYTLMNEVLKLLKANKCTIIGRDIGIFCSMKVGIPIGNCDGVLKSLSEIPNTETKKIV